MVGRADESGGPDAALSDGDPRPRAGWYPPPGRPLAEDSQPSASPGGWISRWIGESWPARLSAGIPGQSRGRCVMLHRPRTGLAHIDREPDRVPRDDIPGKPRCHLARGDGHGSRFGVQEVRVPSSGDREAAGHAVPAAPFGAAWLVVFRHRPSVGRGRQAAGAVAVVVAMPVALEAASRHGMSAGRLTEGAVCAPECTLWGTRPARPGVKDRLHKSWALT
jgi:hypothetical protein